MFVHTVSPRRLFHGSNSKGRAATIVIATLFFLVTIAPNLAAQDDDQSNPLNEEIAMPIVTGQVLDSRNKPIDDVKIAASLSIYSQGDNKQLSTHNLETKCDEEGKYSIDWDKEINKKIQKGCNIYVSVKCNHEKYISRSASKWTEVKDFNGKLKKVNLKRGVKVTGRMVGPKPGDPVPELGTIEFGQKMSMDWNYDNAFGSKIKCDEEGAFECLVPEDDKVMLVAKAKNFPPTLKTIETPKRETDKDDEVHDLGEIQFRPGTIISGVVLDQEGVPCPGVMVIATYKTGNRNNIGNISSIVETDIEGAFELPPQAGKCRISTTKGRNVDGEYKKAKREIVTKELVLNLDGKKERVDVEIVEEPVFKIRGTVSAIDGADVEGTTIYLGSESNNELNHQTEVKADGSFEIEMIGDIPGYIYVVGRRKSGGSISFKARLTTQSLEENRDFFKSSAADTGYIFRHKGASKDHEMNFELITVDRQRERSFGGMVNSWFKGYMNGGLDD